MSKLVYSFWWGVLLLLVGCSSYMTTPPVRIALLAPFEGRHREVGYQALYAARLAIAETERTDIDLLAVNDGGTVDRALSRAAALNRDPLVRAVVLLGPYATADSVRERLQAPVWHVGVWDDAAGAGVDSTDRAVYVRRCVLFAVFCGADGCAGTGNCEDGLAAGDGGLRGAVRSGGSICAGAVTDSSGGLCDDAGRYRRGAGRGRIAYPERPDYTYRYEGGWWVRCGLVAGRDDVVDGRERVDRLVAVFDGGTKLLEAGRDLFHAVRVDGE